jgi:hypothetical protein
MNVKAARKEGGFLRHKTVYVYQSHDEAARRALAVSDNSFTIVINFDHRGTLRVEVCNNGVITKGVIPSHYILKYGSYDRDESAFAFADSFHISLGAQYQRSAFILALAYVHIVDCVRARHSGQ